MKNLLLILVFIFSVPILGASQMIDSEILKKHPAFDRQITKKEAKEIIFFMIEIDYKPKGSEERQVIYILATWILEPYPITLKEFIRKEFPLKCKCCKLPMKNKELECICEPELQRA